MSCYINKDFILKDLEKFSKMMTEKYELMSVPYVYHVDNKYSRFGYFVYDPKKGRNYIVYNDYERNGDLDEYIQKTRNWTIVNNGTSSFTSYERTLGDVMNELRIKERDMIS